MLSENFSFEVLKEKGTYRTGKINTHRGQIETPAFMVVGTQGTVKSAFIEDVVSAGTQIILCNTYHLMIRPGSKRIKRVGGLHQFINCKVPILTDSGGFQVMSLSKLVKIDKKIGAVFNSHIDGKKFILDEGEISITPEGKLHSLEVVGKKPVLLLYSWLGNLNAPIRIWNKMKSERWEGYSWTRLPRQKWKRSDLRQLSNKDFLDLFSKYS